MVRLDAIELVKSWISHFVIVAEHFAHLGDRWRSR
jgi:hypothetical protein